MMPWIAEADQKVLFKDNVHFSTPEEQVQSSHGLRHMVRICAASSHKL